MSTSSELPESTRCPKCGSVITRTSGVSHQAAPKPGDRSICVRCGAVSMFTAELQLRPASVEELTAIPPEEAEKIRRLQGHIWMVLQRRN